MTRSRWPAALAAVVLAVLPVGVLPAGPAAAGAPVVVLVDDEPPAVAGQRYEAALRQLRDWYAEAIVLVVPLGLPERADRDQLTVDRIRLVNPGWTNSPGARPVVWLYLVAPVPQLVGKTLREAREMLIPPGICVSWSPRDATDDWIVTEQKPVAGTPFAVTNCYVPQTRDVSPPAVVLRAADLVRVPDVRDQPESDARAAIESSGLVFALDLLSDGPGPGRVLRQSPLPGEAVPRGSRVQVSVDRSVVPTTAPTVDPGHHTLIPAALRTATAAGVGLLVLLLLLALVGLSLVRRRLRRDREPQLRTQVHFPAGDLRIETVGGAPGHVVSVRHQFDQAGPILEEVGR